MSQKTSEKSTYSVDEMMEKLRQGEREKDSEGELITREDGTQVIRVKKRKRRSKQKKIEEAKRKERNVLLRTFVIVAIPLITGLFVIYLFAKYSSESFSDSVVANLWEKTGAHADLSLSPRGNRISANAVTLSWPDGSPLDKLQVNQVEGDITLLSFLTGKFRGTELQSDRGHLLVSNRENRKISQPTGKFGEFPGFERYSCDNFSFFFGSMKSPFRLEGSKIGFAPTSYSHLLTLTDGDLFAKSWGSLSFRRGTVEFLGDVIKVISLQFEEEDRSIVLSGKVALSDSLHSLTVEVVEGSVGNTAGFEFDKLITSELKETTGTLAFRPWNINTHEVTLSCQPEYLTIQNFAFLDVLEEIYGNNTFEEFEFEIQNTFELIRNINGSELRNLDVVELGVFALKGSIKVTEGKLGGVVKIGLPDHKRLTIRDDQRAAFFAQSQLEDGFFWFEVTLDGTPTEPKDNFRNYLEKGRSEDVQDLFDQLTR